MADSKAFDRGFEMGLQFVDQLGFSKTFRPKYCYCDHSMGSHDNPPETKCLAVSYTGVACGCKLFRWNNLPDSTSTVKEDSDGK